MVYPCNQLMPGLMIGPIPYEGDFVAQAGWDVLVLCAHENEDPAKYPGVEVIVAPGSDAVPMRAHDDQRWLEAGRLVAERVKEGKQVLVTCMQGQNRSGFVCAVALHHLKGFSGKRAVEYVQKHRPGSLWNKAFVTWLTTNLEGSDQ